MKKVLARASEAVETHRGQADKAVPRLIFELEIARR